MSNIRQIKSDIQRAIADERITKSELARRARLPVTTLIGMDREDWNPKSSTLEALEVALRTVGRKPRPNRRASFQPAA